jgi:hypothetical protein
MSLEPAEHGYFAFDIIREREEPNTSNVPASNAETAAAHLFDLLKFCATLKPLETGRDLFQSLQDSRREELITEIGQWADQRVPVSELHRKIQNSVRSEDFFEQLRTGDGAFDFAAALAGLIVPVLTDTYRLISLLGNDSMLASISHFRIVHPPIGNHEHHLKGRGASPFFEFWIPSSIAHRLMTSS